jgi:hypothetical protein
MKFLQFPLKRRKNYFVNVVTTCEGDMLDNFEGKDLQGYVWEQDLRYDDYYFLKDFEHLVVMKVSNYSQSLPQQHWEAIVFEDETCQKVAARQEFATKREAQESLEYLVEISLKNKKTEL